MNAFLDKLGFWVWFFTIAMVGAIVSIITKADFSGLDKKSKLRKITAGILASMFVAYIVFELTLYFFGAERFSVACAGIASYMGTDALVALTNVFITLIIRNKNI
ncbi:MAG: phage holin family protein [Campylobacteraceae bacterium]|jgi:hypothetical protein|nr:phage holin family protein [Campylobacteraceae bacterium]